MARKRKKKQPKQIETLQHEEASRTNIPTAEHQTLMSPEEQRPIYATYERRNRDLDPQLMWRGKDEQDWSDLVVPAPPLYIQEKVHPKVLIDDLRAQSKERADAQKPLQLDLFAAFDGLPKDANATDFYQHEANWTNRMILGDSLQVMASLAEREGLQGKVQCIYFDPPYGIKFNSNFQWSTTNRNVKDGNIKHITREPEQVKAFRDTWRNGIHSYLAYLRDRLTVARDLLTESGSIFVQISDENVHRVRCLLEEVFGEDNYLSQIIFRKTTAQSGQYLPSTNDLILWYGKNRSKTLYHTLFQPREGYGWVNYDYIRTKDSEYRRMSKHERLNPKANLPDGAIIYRRSPLTSPDTNETSSKSLTYQNKLYSPGKGHWKTSLKGVHRLGLASRLEAYGKTLSFRRFVSDFPYFPLSDTWLDTAQGGYGEAKTYVVQTNQKVIDRCILMTTNPGDIVLDPTCGSGTTARSAEQWGRRWITIDTSRVSLALARARIMGSRYPYYLLSDSKAGQLKEAGLTHNVPSQAPTFEDIRQGFVYERAPRIMLKSIANNAEVDVIWETFQQKLEPLRKKLNAAVGKDWQEWEIPRDADTKWSRSAKKLHADWWKQRIERQRQIDASIAAKADQEYLYDKPYEDKNTVRVAGPFTVESLSPHRTLAVNEHDELIEQGTYSSGENFIAERGPTYGGATDSADFSSVILENLKMAGVQQAHRENRIAFTSLTGWPGEHICAEGRYLEGETDTERRAGIFIGPEFGTVARQDLVRAAREVADAGFDVLIACAFSYDAHSTEFEKLGRIPVLKARMNADLHMANDLKNTGKGNLFVIFGEPDIKIHEADNDQIQVQIRGVDVFHPQSGEVRSSDPDDIACWFIDTDYNEESFFVRHAYFLGANDPYKALKTTLKAEIDHEAWASLHSDMSRPFNKPKTGRIAVKVINHLGDEVMKVFSV